MIRIERKGELGQIPYTSIAEAGTTIAFAPTAEIPSQIAETAATTIADMAGMMTPLIIYTLTVRMIMFIVGLFDKPTAIPLEYYGRVTLYVTRSGDRLVFSYDNNINKEATDEYISRFTDQATAQSFINDLRKGIGTFLGQIKTQADSVLATVPSENIDMVMTYIYFPIHEFEIYSHTRESKEHLQNQVKTNLIAIGNLAVQLVGDAIKLSSIKGTGFESMMFLTAMRTIPGLAIEVEAMWRRELERLTIKLTGRREYTRDLQDIMWGLWGRTIGVGDGTDGLTPAIDRGLQVCASLGVGGGLNYTDKPHLTISPAGGAKIKGWPQPLIDYANYLTAEIPNEAKEYIEQNLASSDAYYYTNFKGFGSCSATWCPRITRLPMSMLHGGEGNGHDFWRKYPVCAQIPLTQSCIGAQESQIQRVAVGGYTCGTGGGTGGCFLRSNIPLPQTNIPEAINSMLQDIIDLYLIWRVGYGEEWKTRAQEKVFIEKLKEQEIRRHLRPIIDQMLAYAGVYIEVGPSIQDITVEVNQEIYQIERLKTLAETQKEYATKEIENLENTLNRLKANQDFIVDLYGIDEYKMLLGDVENNLTTMNELLEKTKEEIVFNQEIYAPEEFNKLTSEIDSTVKNAQIKIVNAEVVAAQADLKTVEAEKEDLASQVEVLEQRGETELASMVQGQVSHLEDVVIPVKKTETEMVEGKLIQTQVQAGMLFGVPWWLLLVGGGLFLGLSYLKKRSMK